MEHNGRVYVGQKCPFCGVQEAEREMGEEESGKRGVTRKREERNEGREGGEKRMKRED